MYEQITPEQWIYGAAVGLAVIGVLLVLLFRATLPRAERQNDMSSSQLARLGSLVLGLVHVLVGATSTEPDASDVVVSGEAPTSPDTDAVEADTEMPRLSRHNTERELIIYLALQIKPGGKHRFSANDICALMKGKRADVLAVVRQVREPSPQFREYPGPLADISASGQEAR